jgi:hypothetical protein
VSLLDPRIGVRNGDDDVGRGIEGDANALFAWSVSPTIDAAIIAWKFFCRMCTDRFDIRFGD